jgi:amino acid adenylation domain-containing protein
MLLSAAFNALLFRYTGQQDIAIGTISAYRTRHEFEPIIGCFVNPLVLRQYIDPAMSFSALLKQMRDEALQAFDHQDAPFERVVEALMPDRQLGDHPLFRYLLIYQNMSGQALNLHGIELEPVTPAAPDTALDLTLWIEPRGADLQCTALYDLDQISAETLDRVLSHLERLLWIVIEQPDITIGEIDFLSSAERSTLLVEFSGLQQMRRLQESEPSRASENHGSPARSAIVTRFEVTADRTPDHIAIIDGQRRVSLNELHQTSLQVSTELLRRGVRAGDRVAIELERGAQAIAAMIGVLRVNAIYVPLEPDHPPQRRNHILTDSASRFLINDHGILELRETIDQSGQDQRLTGSLRPERISYLLYTSGSTGKPKGVLGTERGMLNRIDWQQRYLPWTTTDRVVHKTSLAFVDSVWEIFGPLTAGVCIVVASRERVQDPRAFLRLIESQQISHLVAVPSYLRALCDGADGDATANVRVCISSGEPLPADLPGRLQTIFPGSRIFNIYGSTEVAADATCADVSNDEVASAGTPIDGGLIYVLDDRQAPVPIGCVGEVYVGGLGVSTGYWNEQTGQSGQSARFIANPFTSGRLFRSGDLGRFNHRGQLEVLGRSDRQVKVRGHRIELAEIEAACSTLSGLKSCWVESEHSEQPDDRLVLYVSPILGEPAIRLHLRQRLPKYMMPTRIIELAELPLNSSGKVDRPRLKAMTVDELSETVAPLADIQNDTLLHRLTRVWIAQLGRNITHDEDFFDSGGHSLLGVRLVRAIEAEFGIRVPVALLFEHPSINAMATQLRRSSAVEPTRSSLLETLRAADATITGASTPLVGFPPLGHTALFFGQLVNHVNRSWPVLSITDLNVGELDSFDQLTSQLARDLLAQFPLGPYCLTGFCLGSHFAYEVGRKLALNGRPVLVAVVDGICPRCHAIDPPESASSTLRLLRRMFRSAQAQGLGYFPRRIRSVWRELRDPVVRGQVRLQRKLFEMTESYRAEPSTVRIVCIESEECRISRSYDSHAGWQLLAQGGFESIVFPGSDHASVTSSNSRYAPEIAQAISKALAESTVMASIDRAQ